MSGRLLAVLATLAMTATGCRGGAGSEESAAPATAAAPAAAAPGGMCLEHGVPEALCTRCNPALAAVFKAKGDWCQEHGFPESFCPICNPDAEAPDVGPTPAAVIEARTVRFRSPEIEQKAGIRTVAARPTRSAASIECTAQIAFDGDRIADVRAIVPGVVRRVRVELGARVARGAPLFDLESTSVGEIQGALQTSRERLRAAQANADRLRELHQRGITSAREVEVAEQELATAQAETSAAQAALRMAGAARASPSGRYTLSAPIGGTIVRRPGVVGILATDSTSLATIADTSVMWALCDVAEADASRVAVGQKAVVTVEGSDDSPLEGEITWIAAEVDPRTRTVTARAEIANPDGRLRANQFARARVETGASRSAVSVPREAVQRVGDREVVFVRTSAGVYAPRVVARSGHGDLVQVEGNLRDGDQVVTTGAVLLRTEVMPGSIGAGCCETDPPRDP